MHMNIIIKETTTNTISLTTLNSIVNKVFQPKTLLSALFSKQLIMQKSELQNDKTCYFNTYV